MKELGKWRLNLWVPIALHRTEKAAALAFKQRQLPLALAAKELEILGADAFTDHDCRLLCDDFLQAMAALSEQRIGTVLPDYLNPNTGAESFLRLRMKKFGSAFQFRLAWNPRLLRLNPHAARKREFLVGALTRQLQR